MMDIRMYTGCEVREKTVMGSLPSRMRATTLSRVTTNVRSSRESKRGPRNGSFCNSRRLFLHLQVYGPGLCKTSAGCNQVTDELSVPPVAGRTSMGRHVGPTTIGCRSEKLAPALLRVAGKVPKSVVVRMRA